MSLCWKPQMRNTTALRGVYGADRLRSERVWLTEVSACELGQDSERARLGGAGAWLPILRILDQSLLTAIVGDEAGHVFHPQTVPGDMSPSWPLSFTKAAHRGKTKKYRQMASRNECSTARDDYAKHGEGTCSTWGTKKKTWGTWIPLQNLIMVTKVTDKTLTTGIVATTPSYHRSIRVTIFFMLHKLWLAL